MADIDHGNAGFVAQPHEIGQDLLLALLVQRSQRLVQQQQPRLRQQRASERHALAFAAGQLAGAAIQQMADVEQFGDALPLRGIVGEAVHAPPVVEILAHVEMRKQPRVLEHIADAAAIGRRHGFVSRCRPASRRRWRSMPRSGRSSPAIMLISDVLPAPDAPNSPVTRPSLANEASTENSPSCFETSTRSMINSRAGAAVARRANHSEATSAAVADQNRHHDQPQRRGIAIRRLDQRIDRRGNGLGLAGNVGHEM